MVFSDVAVYSSRWVPAYRSNGDGRFLRNIGTDLPDFIISNSRSLQCYILCWHSCDFIFINNYIMTHLSKNAMQFSCCKHYLLTRHAVDINFNFKLTQNWMWLYYLNGSVVGQCNCCYVGSASCCWKILLHTLHVPLTRLRLSVLARAHSRGTALLCKHTVLTQERTLQGMFTCTVRKYTFEL